MPKSSWPEFASTPSRTKSWQNKERSLSHLNNADKSKAKSSRRFSNSISTRRCLTNTTLTRYWGSRRLSRSCRPKVTKSLEKTSTIYSTNCTHGTENPRETESSTLKSCWFTTKQAKCRKKQLRTRDSRSKWELLRLWRARKNRRVSHLLEKITRKNHLHNRRSK